QRVDKPSHSVSVLRAGAHECQIHSAPVLVLPRLQRFSITLKRTQRAKIKFILALCQQSEASLVGFRPEHHIRSRFPAADTSVRNGFLFKWDTA
ncbi:hypothetical protein CEY02_01165, partial [Bacillus pumilus]